MREVLAGLAPLEHGPTQGGNSIGTTPTVLVPALSGNRAERTVRRARLINDSDEGRVWVTTANGADVAAHAVGKGFLVRGGKDPPLELVYRGTMALVAIAETSATACSVAVSDVLVP